MKRLAGKLESAFGSRLLKVVAFGSRVRGDFSGESDFDLLIVIKDMSLEDELQAIHIVSEEEEKTGIPYSPVVKNSAVFYKEMAFKTGFYTNIEQEGVVFHDAIG